MSELPIGFLTVPFGNLSLKEVAEFGGRNGFEFLELAAWPGRTSRTEGEAAYVANHLGDNLKDFTQMRADDINANIQKAGMKGISAMAFYENMLTANAEERAFYHNHFKELVPASEKLGVKLIGLFPGRNQNLSVEGSLVEYGKVFPDMVKFAGDHGRKAMYEPCPMEWWIIDPKTGKPHRIGNIAYCPENWRRINEMTPDMGINMDFSHLIWQNIDYLRAANEFGNHIVHVHGKDARLLEGVRKVKNGLVYVDSPHAPDSTLDNSFEKGLFRDDWPVEGWGAGLYEHAIPGEGDLSWEEIVKALKGNGYSGPISVELEASKYKPRDDPELSKVGMIRSRNHLLQFV